MRNLRGKPQLVLPIFPFDPPPTLCHPERSASLGPRVRACERGVSGAKDLHFAEYQSPHLYAVSPGRCGGNASILNRSGSLSLEGYQAGSLVRPARGTPGLSLAFASDGAKTPPATPQCAFASCGDTHRVSARRCIHPAESAREALPHLGSPLKMRQPPRRLRKGNNSRCHQLHRTRRVRDDTRPDTPEPHPRHTHPRTLPTKGSCPRDFCRRHRDIGDSSVPSSQSLWPMTSKNGAPS